MEAIPEQKVECEQGCDSAVGLIGGEMEAGVETESEVLLEEIEVDSMLSCKNQPLYKIHEPQFVAIFPEEVWALILGQLKNDPDSQKNCANASPYFWELLKKERVVLLFPDILKFLVPYTMERKFGMNLEIEENVFEEVEYDFWIDEDTKAWRSAILNCRLVCPTWNSAVEHSCQWVLIAGIPELSLHSHDPRCTDNRVLGSWTNGLFKLDNLESVLQFLGKFEESHFSGIASPPKNPIFGRYLALKLFGSVEYRKGLTKILEGCGKDIWYCCMDLSFHLPIRGNDASAEIAKVLELMPNLQYLKIVGPDNVRNLSKFDFQVDPIPKLKKLKMLEVEEISGLIVSEMLWVNNHVGFLRMRMIENGMDLEVGGALTNLRDFFPMRSHSKFGERMLEVFGHRWKQLERLYLERGSEYFGTMERNWGNTLTVLDLKDPFGRDEGTILKESRVMRLNLPGIQKLSLWIEGLFYLDFIKPMKNSLEHLKIQGIEFKEGRIKKKVKKRQSIELAGFEGKMHKSNIWEFFGKLQTVEIKLGQVEEFLLFSKEGNKYLCIF